MTTEVDEHDLDALRTKQLAREYEAQTLAAQKVHADSQKAQNRGDPLRSPSTRTLADHWTGPLADYIATVADNAKHSKGPKPRWLKKALRFLDAETLASVTIKAILATIISERRVKLSTSGKLPKALTSSHLAGTIGLAISKASRLTAFRKLNPALFAAIDKGQNEQGSTPQHKDAVLNIKLNTTARDPERASAEFLAATESWTTRERHSIGQWMFAAAVKCTGGRIELKRHWKDLKSGRGTSGYWHVDLHPSVYEWLANDIEQHASHATFERAMVCPPVPWEGPKGGGYLLADITSPNLIRGATPGPVRRMIKRKGIPQSPVLSAINHLQSVPFSINEAVFSVASEAVAARLNLAQLPESYRTTVPPAPPKENTTPEEFAEWRRKAAIAKRTNERNKARVLWSMGVIKEAEELRGEPLWFAAAADYRGRVYANGSGLNPQGGSLARHMLLFHKGRPIGDGDGPRWLAYQVARSWGHEKATWDERLEWTEANTDMLKRIADDPLGNRTEWEAEAGPENIWPALSAAREWTDYVESGRSPLWETRLPIWIDASASGLQFFAGLTRDRDLGRIVNLVPSDRPRDLYQEIADTAHRNISRIAMDYGANDRQEALLWLRVLGERAPRSLTKQIVMCKPYGAAHVNVYDVVWDYLDKEDPLRLHWGGDVRTPDEEKGLVHWLGNQLQRALGDRTQAATNVMAWLRAAMGLLCEGSKDGGDGEGERLQLAIERLDWRTPSGWPWHSIYYGKTPRRVSVRFDGKTRESNFAETNVREILTKRCLKAASPNYIHGLDSACLMIAVERMKAAGIESLVTVHDCYAGLAPDMSVISRCAREAFIAVHEADPLLAFRDAVLRALPDDDARSRLPPLGPLRTGDLDVKGVINSLYMYA